MLIRFLRSTRAGATAIAVAVVVLMTLGGGALVVDHLYLVDQRDMLKSASNAARIAATQEMGRLMSSQPGITNTALEAALLRTARRYIMLNLEHLSPERYIRAQQTLVTTLMIDRRTRTVDVAAEAELGGLLFSKHVIEFVGLAIP